jgi:hypothetical protein
MIYARIFLKCSGKDGKGVCKKWNSDITLTDAEMAENVQSAIAQKVDALGWWYQNEFDQRCPDCKP